jgi:predicted ester cyclase
LVIEELVEAGDKIWARMTATGKARNGKKIRMHVFDICRFENEKLVEHWGVPDRFALLHQAGLLPPRPPQDSHI